MSNKIGFIILIIVLSAGASLGQTSAFTYQGRLTDGGTPANGNYDLQFALFDAAGGTNQIGPTQAISNVAVTGGVFTVTLDFGANAFSGASRFLEISARPSGAAAFTLLTPRQQLTSTPYAVRSLNTATADAATNAQQLGGVAAAQYVKTDDARMSDARDPKTGSSNYIQNTINSQAGANFNISGNGTAGGTLSGNTVNAATQYNLGGQKILGMSGPTLLKFGDNVNVGTGPTVAPDYKLDVETFDKNGLRVGTNTPGGTALSVGGYGDVQVDSFASPGGRLTVKENGNVGIGITSTSKLAVAGMVESTAGGFKFPDGSEQTTAAAKAYVTKGLADVGLDHSGLLTNISTLNLPAGVYLLTATVQFQNKADDLFADNTRRVKCYFNDEFLGTFRLGAPNNPMDFFTTTMHTLFTQPASGPVSFKCGDEFLDTGKVVAKARRFSAVRVADNPVTQ